MAIIRNAIQCKKCGDIIESVSVHDFKTCSCEPAQLMVGITTFVGVQNHWRILLT